MAEIPKSPMTVAELRRALDAADPEAIVFVVVTEDGYRLPNPEGNDEVGHPFDVGGRGRCTRRVPASV